MLRKKPRTDILSAQKPKKMRRRRKRFFVFIGTGAFLTICFIFVSYYFISHHQNFFRLKPKMAGAQQPLSAVKINWKITLKFKNDGRSPTIPELEQIQGLLNTNVPTGRELELDHLSTALQKRFTAQSVNILRLSFDQLYISIFERLPIMRLEWLNRHFLLTATGEIYKPHQETAGHALPVVKNLLPENNELISFQPDGTLQIDEESQLYLKEALELFQSTIHNGYKVKELLFEPYRGFSFILDNPEIEIKIGRSPFDIRFKNLQKVLNKIKLKNMTVSKIELDYDGKAFISQ